MSEAVASPTKRQLAEAATSPTIWQIFKVALASIVGPVIEQYDFLVTGVIAATVWGGVFFKLPGVAAVAAVAAAIGVYGIGVIIRPVGAYFDICSYAESRARSLAKTTIRSGKCLKR